MTTYNSITLPRPAPKRTKCTLILNEQHTMTPQQQELLESKYETIDLLHVPAEGWTWKEQETQYMLLREGKPLGCPPDCGDIIFLSPLPVMLAAAAFQRGYLSGYDDWAEQEGQGCKYTSYTPRVYLFHNDQRIKNEKDGKIWYSVPQDGWILQYISAPLYYD